MKAILFDLDDTLIESMHVWSNAITYLFKQIRVDMDFQRGKDLFTKMTFHEVLRFIQKEFDVPYSFDELHNIVYGYIYDQYANHIQPKRGAIEYIRQCDKAGIVMCILTSNSLELTKVILQRLGVESCIKHIYAAQDLRMSKKEPEIYQLALRDLDVRPKDVVVFEDSMYAIQTATRVGIPCIGLHTDDNKHIFDEYMVPSIRDFTELEVSL